MHLHFWPDSDAAAAAISLCEPELYRLCLEVRARLKKKHA